MRSGPRAGQRAGCQRSGLLLGAVQPFALLGIDLIGMALAMTIAGQKMPRVALAAMVVIAFNGLGRVYTTRIPASPLDRGLWLTGSGCVTVLVVSGGTASIIAVALCAALFTVLALCGRSVLCHVIRRAHQRGGAAPTLLIGAGTHGQRLARSLLAHPEYGLLPVGFLDELAGDSPSLPVLGRLGDLAGIVQTYGIRRVVIAEQGQQSTARTARALGCEVYLAPDQGELLVDFVTAREHAHGFPLLRMRPEAQRSLSWPLKRALDIVTAVTALIVAAPLLAVCAVAIRWKVGAGPLFRQRRVGYRGRPIELIKLRTMKPANADESATLWSIAHDSRVGPVGRLLRRTSIDELPQLWNVLKGDMSITGPRPERPHFVEEFARTIPGYGLRHRMPVGITGWAQVHGLRGDTSIEDRARFDNHYIDGWTLRLDVKIMMWTLWSLLRVGGS